MSQENALFIIPWSPDAIGGVNTVVTNLYRHIDTFDHIRPMLMINGFHRGSVARVQTDTFGPVDQLYIPSPPMPGEGIRQMLSYIGRVPAAVIRVTRYLRREKFCAINLHYPSLSVLVILLARFFADRSIQIVLSFHGMDLNQLRRPSRLSRWCWRFALMQCNALVVCSQALADELDHSVHGLGNKLKVIHNGVDVETCREVARSTTLPQNLRDQTFIASVGTFENKKGQDVLIDAFSTIANAVPDLCLALVGRSGPRLSRIKEQIASLGLEERVMVMPDLPHNQTLAVIAAAEVFVLPSRKEPFGIVILEAACLGTPVIASCVGGVPEVIEDGVTGVLLTPDDPSALSAAVIDLLGDPETRRRYSNNLHDVVVTRFTALKMVGRYATVLAPHRYEPVEEEIIMPRLSSGDVLHSDR